MTRWKAYSAALRSPCRRRPIPQSFQRSRSFFWTTGCHLGSPTGTLTDAGGAVGGGGGGNRGDGQGRDGRRVKRVFAAIERDSGETGFGDGGEGKLVEVFGEFP